MKKDDCIKELESTLHDQRLINNRQLEEIKLLNDKLHSEARRVKSLERESDRLRSEISLLEAKVGGLGLSEGTIVHHCIALFFNIMPSFLMFVNVTTVLPKLFGFWFSFYILTI